MSRLHFLGSLLLFLPAFALFAQCPPTPSVWAAYQSWDTEAVKSVISQIEGCEAYRDSLGMAYHRLGVFHYYDEALSAEEQAMRAMDATQKAISIWQGLEPVPDSLLGGSYLNLSFFHESLDELEKAEEYAQLALQAFNRAGHPRAVNALQKLGNYMEARGDYNKALDYLELARQKAEELRDTVRIGACYNSMSRVLYFNGQREEALERANLAYQVFTSLPADRQDAFILASVLQNKGNSLAGLGRYEEAVDAYQQAQAFAQQFGNDGQIMSVQNDLSVTLKKVGRLSESRQKLLAVLAMARRVESPGYISGAYDNLGDLAILEGNYRQGLDHYQQAMAVRLPGFQPGAASQNPDRGLLSSTAHKTDALNFLKNKAFAWKKRYEKEKAPAHLQNAIETYRLADGLIDQMRREHSGQETKLFWRNTTRELYEQAIDACYLLGDAEQAFYFMEKSRAILLLDALLAGNARRILPDSIAGRELRLKRDLLRAQQRLEGGNGTVGQVLAAQDSLRQFVALLEEAYPAYHAIRYEVEVAEPAAIQAGLLDDNSGFVEYFLTEEALFVLHFGQQSAPSLTRYSRDEAFTGQLQGLLAYLSGQGSLSPGQYQELAFPLFEKLLGPLAEQDYHKLLIVPDGELAFLPFEALLASPAPANSFGQLDYLAKSYTIYYAYSATVLANLIPHELKGHQLLQIAPRFEKGQRSLPPLTNTQRGMGNLAGYQLLSSGEATKEQFLRQASDTWLIHLTTHASTGDDGKSPRIEFIDEALELDELYAMALSASLVVLDACETNIGKVEAGEGAMSLARGFAFAGANSMVSSLWKVRDQYTAILFREFYQQLLTGKSKAEALREAKLAYLAQAQTSAEKSPRNWAGFVYIGKDGQIGLAEISPLEAAFTSYGWLGGLLLLSGLAFWFLRRRLGK